DVDAREMGSKTPLMIAGQEGVAAAVQPLLDHGADLEAQASNGWTALDFALWKEDADTIAALSQAKVKDLSR
ncbi:MAG: ankyrin repeat domain-containing protein, partial [Synergistaceae bacterium]|nr:ankyrin repeat domain-containing protein [Synergistaceae bacterium]